jgi:hypothetical protein
MESINKNQLQIEKLLFIMAGVWFCVGLILAFRDYRDIWYLSKFNHLNLEERNLNLYGSDYEIYRFLQNTDQKTKILFMVPDVYYLPKSVFFLYPRPISVIGYTKQFYQSNLEADAYFLIYVPIEKYSGIVKGIKKIAQEDWTLEKIWAIDQKVSKDKMSLVEFQNKLSQNRGILLYKLK